MPFPHVPLSRRRFLGGMTGGIAGGWLALPSLAQPSLALQPHHPVRKAAVIGHTGRGDYGHGLDLIFQNRPGIALVAVADPDDAGREAARVRTGAARAYANYRELLEKEQPELVSVAPRHADQHHAIGMACLQAGAHVYFEKPFTRTPAEADVLLATAARRGLRIAVAHTMRMMPVILQLRENLRQGLIGDLLEMRAYGKQDHRAGGEDMMVLGTHLFDLMRALAGDPLWVNARVQTEGRDITPADRRLVRDNVGWVAGNAIFAHFAFENGVEGTFTSQAGLRNTASHWGIELHGSKGSARINGDMAPNVFVRSAGPWTPGGRTDRWQPLDPDLRLSPETHNLGPVGDWLQAIDQGREPECSGRNGAWAVEMVMGVYAAALSGSRTAFPLTQRVHPLD